MKIIDKFLNKIQQNMDDSQKEIIKEIRKLKRDMPPGFAYEDCLTCGIEFMIPKEFQRKAKKSYEDFYCPRGHEQHYLGETEEQKLRKKLAVVQEDYEHCVINLRKTIEEKDTKIGELRKSLEEK